MSGGRKGSQSAKQATAGRATASASRAAQPPAPPDKSAPTSPKGKQRKGAGGAAEVNNAREDALAEARDMAEAVAEGPTPPRSPKKAPKAVPNKEDRPATLEQTGRREDRATVIELNKERAKAAALQAHTERLEKELENLKAKKRKESDAAEAAPPAKRAVGRRSATQSGSVPVPRKRQSVYSSILCYLFRNFVT